MAPSSKPESSASDSPRGSFYQDLNLPSGATPQELRQAFRHLSKLYHPDTTQLPPEVAQPAFARLQMAYSTLSDPMRRQAYDRELALLAVPSLPPLHRSAPGSEGGSRVSVRRALSGGEWFALLLLGVALILSLVLGLGVAWARGAALINPPSWWVDGGVSVAETPLAPSDAQTALNDPPLDVDAPL